MEGKINGHHFRIKIKVWSTLSMDFTFSGRPENNLSPALTFRLSKKEKDAGPLVKFLKETIPDSLEDTILVNVIIEEAVRAGWF